MKRSASGRRDSKEDNQRQRSVKWDEANLEENVKVQKEVNPVKINEPKTPYHGPLASDDEDLGETLSPLSLEDDAAVEHLADETNYRASDEWREAERRNGGHSDSERGYQSSGARSDSWGSSCHTPTSNASSGLLNGEDLDGDSITSAGKEERHRKFVARRKQHYNMRDALKRGKELMQHEGEPPGQATSRAANGVLNHDAKSK